MSVMIIEPWNGLTSVQASGRIPKKSRVGRLEMDLDRSLLGIEREFFFYCHDYVYPVTGKDPSAGYKAVYSGEHGDTSDICRYHEMQEAYSLISVDTLCPQPFVHNRDLNALLILDKGVVPVLHNKGNEVSESGQRTDKPPVLAVS